MKVKITHFTCSQEHCDREWQVQSGLETYNKFAFIKTEDKKTTPCGQCKGDAR